MGTILVVEDDLSAQEFLRPVLDNLQCVSLMCEDAERALAIADTAHIDLALIDINLPGDHGVSLAWELRQRFSTMRIVIMSALLSQWNEDDIRDCGADAILPKPLDITELTTLIRRLLREGR